ncbi:solute carrier family 5 member 3a [Puntigrus tetrazona]|uniref:solute carrier family 5 member 3a n=1 Tax=Puntigrus tetrazona TaxID=1606681 RepID=UPI001C8ACAFA|nr:solute carrier family 5 member 3a [Puntigrus tetrazona]
MASTMEAADIVVVSMYFVLVLAFGFFAMWKANRGTVSGYFLAGRSMNWMMIGASLFVSNIGSEHFIGLAGSGAASGFAVGAWEFNAILLLQLLGWVFIPVYIHSGVYTMPEYLSKRFGGKRLKVFFASLTLLLYIFTKLSVDLYSGALFIQESLGWNLYVSIILLITMTALLTITGGLVAVIYTDTLQAFLMISGALCLMAISLAKVGGLEGLHNKYMNASPSITDIELKYNVTYSNSCHVHPKPDSFKILRGPLDKDLPWPAFLLGQTPASIWYWCADQVIVQRVLAARNIAHAKGSTLMAGVLKVLPMFIIVIPGMISRVLFADELACISPEHCMQVCNSKAGCTNIAYPRLVMNIMPVGLRGLMMAVMLAALMSDLDSIFNSASTIFTLDIYKMVRRQASSKELMVVGRVFVVLIVAISIAWVPFVVEMQGGQMFLYIQEVSDYLTPPIAALFLLGVLWKRCNETGAFWGGLVGFLLGAVRLILAFVYREPDCKTTDDRPAFIKDIHFMYVAAVLFWVSGLVTVVVSLCTDPPSKEQIATTTWWGLRNRNQTENSKLPQLSVETKKEKTVDVVENKPPSQIIQTRTEILPNCHLESQHTQKQQGSDHLDRDEGRCVKCLQWFWGYNKNVEDPDSHFEDESRNVIEMLREPPKIKIILNLGLLLVCTLGIFLFVYFSL